MSEKNNKFSNEIICPYCGTTQDKSYYYTHILAPMDCENNLCKKGFHFSSEPTMIYSTTKIEENSQNEGNL